jgi:mono/diheme cytochrome c family protein
LLLAPILIGVVLLPGCDKDDYSESIVYPVRRDPVIMPTFSKTREFNEPDPPGMLPLTTFSDIYRPNNILHKDVEAIEKGETLRDPECLDPKDRKTIEKFLGETFGTPANPTVKVAEAATQLVELHLDDTTLKKGSHLYRLHCLHCHGLSGDGRGPSSKWLNPHPRDYRQGLFKFQSVNQAIDGETRRPRREDLHRTIHEGIDGTSMPAFNLLAHEDKNALVSYVMHLSLRGHVEHDTIREFKYDGGKDELYWKRPGGIEPFMKERTAALVQEWHTANSAKFKIVPGPYPEKYLKSNKNYAEEMKASVHRGQDIFLGKVPGGPASCVSCHKDYGRQSTYKWDDWGTLGHKPRDLTRGQLRGGRRPIDLYYRIHSGINGSGMNAFGPLGEEGKSGLRPDQIWDLVNLVQVLPYPAMRKAYELDID